MEGEGSLFMKIPAGVALILVLDGIFQACSRGKLLAVGAALAIAAVLILYSSLVWKGAFPTR